MEIDIGEWGLSRRAERLWLDGQDLTGLAERFGTPVHVVSAGRLRARTAEVLDAFSHYPGRAHIHFSYKTNTVAGVLRVLHDAGLGAEVVNGYELHLARRLGVPGERIVFNGPNKTDAELRAAIDAGVGLLVVDHLEELTRVQSLAQQSEQRVRIGLRVCPDISPRHMNASSLTGSRRNQFGLDLPANEYNIALGRVAGSDELELRGVMAHIGSGIHDLKSFERTVQTLLDLHVAAFDAGCSPDVIDIGGGLGAQLSRELTTFELLAYLGVGRLPKLGRPGSSDLWARYAEVVCGALVDGCEPDEGVDDPRRPGRRQADLAGEARPHAAQQDVERDDDRHESRYADTEAVLADVDEYLLDVHAAQYAAAAEEQQEVVVHRRKHVRGLQIRIAFGPFFH